jgi:transcription initiation factor TFIIIB Brf1 subunit/transcription initiation factor TFIIB|tara:strand:- start:412 stop:1260 length:849 start_codon:yes stop_codon:yes gene_type:complete
MKLICEECRSQNNEFNERLGETVCKDCGLVLITEMFEETVHILDSTGELVHSPDRNKLGSVITGKGSFKYNKYGMNSVLPKHIQNGIRFCNMVLANVAPNSSLQPRIEKLYIDCLNRNIFGRSQYEARATAVVYYALKENGTPHTIKDVCAEFNPNVKSVKRLVRKINQFHRNSINYKPINPQYALIQTLTKITDDMIFRNQCIRVLEYFETVVVNSTFNKGRSYYASIIWIAANVYVKDNITKERICEKTGFSRWIVWKQTKAILNLIGVELVEELKGKEL